MKNKHGFDTPPGITIWGAPSTCSECGGTILDRHESDCSKYIPTAASLRIDTIVERSRL